MSPVTRDRDFRSRPVTWSATRQTTRQATGLTTGPAIRMVCRLAFPFALLLLAPVTGSLGVSPWAASGPVLAQTVPPTLVEAAAPAALAPPDELVLRPGDLIRMQVKDEPHFDGEFPVNEDGTVLVPLAGLVPVAGRPFGTVRAEIRQAFARELVEPVLVITPLVRLAVLGEVRAPGLFPADPTLTLADVLATVGGLTPRADEGKISLVRGGEVIVVRMEPGATLLETRLRSGDQIVVGPQGWAREHMAVLVGAAASVAAAAVTSLIIRR